LDWPAEEVAAQLDDLLAIFGTPLSCGPAWLRAAAELAGAHGLTFYDAAWVAAARGLDISLISADRQLLAAGLADSATTAARRLGLNVPEDPPTASP
jgi:predicted nucleic acid-binding protein